MSCDKSARSYLCDKSAFYEDKLFGIALQLLKEDVEKKMGEDGTFIFDRWEIFWYLGNGTRMAFCRVFFFGILRKYPYLRPLPPQKKQTNKKRDKQESENKQQ